MAYDIIGDLHGCAETLEALLGRLGYTHDGASYRHSERQVLFVGDFIDGGPLQRDTLTLVRDMTSCGAAYAVLGNHEFNAIAYATPHPEDGHLRKRTAKNLEQHRAFLEEYDVDGKAHQEIIAWFKTLPLFLDLGDLRVVHACWHREHIEFLHDRHKGATLTAELLAKSTTRGTREFEVIETLLKGMEIPLPTGHAFTDRYGKERHHIRIRWWDAQAKTYQAKFLGNPAWATHIPNDPITGDHGIEYGHKEPPVFLGHYWLTGTPAPLATNIACVDYSVGRAGALVAYRWDGEQVLSAYKFVRQPRLEP